MHSEPRHSTKLLVIGYGNELRRDDGVGPKVVASVLKLKLPGIHALACQQLTPELADPIASAERVVFVDAALNTSDSVQLRDIEPMEHSQVMTHATDPRSLLALARQAFGRNPLASWITIPVQDLDFGEELSPLARRGVDAALQIIKSLANAPNPHS